MPDLILAVTGDVLRGAMLVGLALAVGALARELGRLHRRRLEHVRRVEAARERQLAAAAYRSNVRVVPAQRDR